MCRRKGKGVLENKARCEAQDKKRSQESHMSLKPHWRQNADCLDQMTT
jgi:hypothetical protein